MRIAILGWGSLVWDPRELHLAGEWQAGGPVLPIEFSRVSDDGRLTLVIDEENGVDVPTRYVVSALTDLDVAIADLQKREGAPRSDAIGFVDTYHNRQSPQATTRHAKSCTLIRAWVHNRKVDAAIWTAISPRFREKTGEPFSVDAAIRYLAALHDPTKTRARTYIRNAPNEVVTPVRKKAEELFAREEQASP